MTDRERAVNFLSKKGITKDSPILGGVLFEAFVDLFVEFHNEGLREELIKYAKSQWTDDDDLINDTLFAYLKTKE